MSLIRPAVPTDFDELCRLFNQSHHLHHQALPGIFMDPNRIVYEKSVFEAAFNQDKEVILVAEEGGDLLGTVHVKIHTTKPQHPGPQVFELRKFGLIHTLVVEEAWRKHGIGHQLLQAAERWVLERGVKEVELFVWSFNQEAHQLYESVGYTPLNIKMYKQLS